LCVPTSFVAARHNFSQPEGLGKQRRAKRHRLFALSGEGRSLTPRKPSFAPPAGMEIGHHSYQLLAPLKNRIGAPSADAKINYELSL
jgi:hypothetical protein